MKITLEMVLTKFFAEFNNTKLLTLISDAQMQHALQGIQLLPRHMHSLSGDYLYVTDQFYYSAEICKDSGKQNSNATSLITSDDTDISFIVFGSEISSISDIDPEGDFYPDRYGTG